MTDRTCWGCGAARHPHSREAVLPTVDRIRTAAAKLLHNEPARRAPRKAVLEGSPSDRCQAHPDWHAGSPGGEATPDEDMAPTGLREDLQGATGASEGLAR